ncbi:MAG TPA: hypothetical protein VGP08_00740 [Pyrinomonadaceae bacterium]|nr:hypothetical protein [Pyrinomonadaceae bacterium]
MSTSVSATAKMRSNLSARHMLAAAYFSRKAGEVEIVNIGMPFGDFYDEIAWSVTAAIFFSVAALEADANEIFIDAHMNLPEYDKELLDTIWEMIEKKTILEKYEMALFLKRKKRFDKGVSAYQDVDGLIKLRNALVHFKAEWSDEKKEHKKIEARLKGKFQLSPFLAGDTEFFPKSCMSHGCAEWAVKTALTFRESFSNEAGLKNGFAAFMPQLSTR